MKKTWGIIVLIIWFMWVTWSGLRELWSPNSTNYFIFDSNGAAFLAYAFGVVLLILHVATLYYLFKPTKTGFYTALSATLIMLLQGFVTVWLVLSNLDGVKAAYIERRRERGLSVRPELYERMFTTEAMIGLLAFTALIFGVILFLLVRNRKYFDSKRDH